MPRLISLILGLLLVADWPPPAAGWTSEVRSMAAAFNLNPSMRKQFRGAEIVRVGAWDDTSKSDGAFKNTFKDCDDCPEMVVVPPGSFMMGSPVTEKGRSSDEGPQHPVNFARAFAVGKFAVTFDEWDACVADGGCNGYKALDAGWGRGRRPAIYVSWDDAKAYVDWLSRKTGKPYRLLSEAEREYVARAGTVTPFWFGSSISSQQANYNGDYVYDGGSKGEYRHQTLLVDAFEENPWGLYQVHGNVWEWTEDCYNDNYRGAPSDGSAWTDGDCGRRVLRGGSSIDYPRDLRAASRNADPADFRTMDDGFRVARDLSSP
jgi:formylglycine-generating enzyme required for sulfatase activity